MDSPFLTNKPLDDEDGTLVLADLSIADEESFDIPAPPRGLPRGAAASTSASSSIASSSSRQPPVAPPSAARPPSKPRFSLFAPGMAEVTPAHTSTLRPAARPPLDPPSERSERSQPSTSQAPERPSESERRPPTFAWDETVQEVEEVDEEERREDAEPERREDPQTAEARDESLRTSLAELKRINTVFDTLMGALEEGRAHNTTSALLDDYVKLLGQAEHTRQLVMNEKWTGAEDDAAALQEEADRAAERAAAEEARRAAEAEEAARRKRERQAAAEREAAAKARSAAATRGRPGVRPTRGGLRGRGSSIPAPSRSRPTSAAGTATGTTAGSGHARTTSGFRRPASGLGGRYANVPSSGYGR
ncbi:hypothetical protein A1Q1_01460 [Trichosporon asahii var. asahii CBS 2479]|uniref:DASH complex subunit DUO1 n=1 Tax=Trichosporon asahii var. asahii (strain ATCC 90039 / CBS 2479 / JCM 2466 / KCTC 7840 / NBRC 103889/ NCYC 2677 / UAMH 7654) TaxID=1186058 RepID=J5QWA7_TRIAS|nr:hypothetical protein A1Q1_01460 [Trichosporon asahii var. asahii CBS 2479]EJT49438.1 hypothetical protein A1Q1_01460 [Trichosporon asahii var. asahii CBS 2479]